MSDRVRKLDIEVAELDLAHARKEAAKQALRVRIAAYRLESVRFVAALEEELKKLEES